MPCYTLVQVEVKDRAMAEKALEQMGEQATITKLPNGQFQVTPKNQRSTFADRFYQEYSVAVATRDAKKDGYYVNRTEENGEITLTLRQY